MTRKNTDPAVNQEEYAVPVEMGGTGAITLAKSALALKLVTTDKKGQVGGPIALGVDGKVAASAIPALAGTNKVNLQGNFFPTTGQVVTWKITDFDSFKNYNISVSAGSFTLSGDTITYTSPGSPVSVTLNIGGRTVNFNVTPAAPGKTTLTSPTNNSSNLPPYGVYMTSAAYVAPSDSSAHASSDWQVATDVNFTNIVSQSVSDTVNKTSWTSGTLSISTTYYLRCRHRSAAGGIGTYSDTIVITTAASFSITTEEAKLVPTTPGTGMNFGCSVSISYDGSRAVIGAQFETFSSRTSAGAAYVFVRTGNSWTLEQRLFSANANNSYYFGASVSMFADGTRVAIGSPGESLVSTGAGAVYIYSRSGSVWTLEQKIVAATAENNANFGRSISISIDSLRLAVGCPNEDATTTTDAGVAYVFTRSGTTWTQEARVTASAPSVNSAFGTSVSISSDGSYLVVGTPNESSGSNTVNGAVYVYTRSGVSWNFQQRMISSAPKDNGFFGISVYMFPDGTRAAIGAYSESNATPLNGVGAVYIFTRTNSVWALETKIDTPNPVANGNFGRSVSATTDGLRLMVGASSETNGTNQGGKVYIYKRAGNAWAVESSLVPSVKTSSMLFGYSVAISGDSSRVVVGSLNDVASSVASGTGYIFR